MKAVASAVLVGVLAVSGSACSDERGRDTPSPKPSVSLEPSTNAAPTKRFSTKTFEQPFSLQLPDDWTSIERDPALVQFWEGDDEEAAPIQLTVLLEKESTVEAAAGLYRDTPGLKATKPAPVTIAGYDGLAFDADATAETLMASQYSIMEGDHIRVLALSTPGHTVAVVLDTFNETAPRGTIEPRIARLEQVLRTIDFTTK